MKPEIKEAFIQLVMALEPERLYQDGERTPVEVEATLKEINDIWKHLEKTHNVSVTQEQAEEWTWEYR